MVHRLPTVKAASTGIYQKNPQKPNSNISQLHRGSVVSKANAFKNVDVLSPDLAARQLHEALYGSSQRSQGDRLRRGQ